MNTEIQTGELPNMRASDRTQRRALVKRLEEATAQFERHRGLAELSGDSANERLARQYQNEAQHVRAKLEAFDGRMVATSEASNSGEAAKARKAAQKAAEKWEAALLSLSKATADLFGATSELARITDVRDFGRWPHRQQVTAAVQNRALFVLAGCGLEFGGAYLGRPTPSIIEKFDK